MLLKVGRRLFLQALTVTAVLASTGFSSAQDKLTVALFPTPPWGVESPGSTSEDQGFMVDLMNAVGEKLGTQIEYQVMPVGQLIQAVLDKKADVFAGPITITEERRALGIEFTTPPLSWSDGVAVRSDDASKYSSVMDLAGIPVGAAANTLYEGLLKNTEGIDQAKSYAGVPEMEAALASGEIKAYLTVSSGFKYGKEHLGMYPSSKLVEGYVPSIHSNGGIGVRRESSQLLGRLNDALKALEDDGTLNTLRAKYHFDPPA